MMTVWDVDCILFTHWDEIAEFRTVANTSSVVGKGLEQSVVECLE
jgi:hypothetical protein